MQARDRRAPVARALLFFVVPAVIIGISIPVASAKGRKNTPATTATVSAPATAAVGENFSVAATGLDPRFPAWFRITDANTTGFVSAGMPDASGRVTLPAWVEWVAGDATFTIESNLAYPSGTSLTPLGSAVVHVS
jgi:hypothetical protein